MSRRVLILSSGMSDAENLRRLDESPEFRKATLNMKMSFLAIRQALEPFAALKDAFKTDMALFMGTSHGEFNSTLDFLKSWSQQRLARPFVFQNSLHNSTTSFVGLCEGYRAPLVTSSQHYFSGEEALDHAMQFLRTGNARIATVMGVDVRAGSQLPHMAGAGFPIEGWGEGAGCVILADENYAREKGLTALGELQDVQSRPDLEKTIFDIDPAFDLSRFYDSHAVEELARAVREGRGGDLKLRKPNGGQSLIRWTAL